MRLHGFAEGESFFLPDALHDLADLLQHGRVKQYPLSINLNQLPLLLRQTPELLLCQISPAHCQSPVELNNGVHTEHAFCGAY
ncbi:hypothetical protein D3C73_1619210 [compost metagenome]